MEQFQQLLDECQSASKAEVSPEEKRKRADFMKKVIDSNLNISEEVRGVIIDGKEKLGVQPTSGWGSDIRVQVDNASGTIDYVER